MSAATVAPLRYQRRSAGADPPEAAQATPVPTNGRFLFPSASKVSDPTTYTPPAEPLGLDDRLKALAEEAAVDTGLFVVGVNVRGRSGSRVVEVFADAEEGATVDALADLSRRLSFLLDTEDPVKGHYRLDVSTPGLDRPLTDRRQFTRHVGRSLSVALGSETDTDPQETADGELASVEPDALVLRDKSGADRTISFDTIREARVVLPW